MCLGGKSPLIPALRMGLRYVKGLGVRERDLIEKAREQGPFVSVQDFTDRTELNERALNALAEAGAFEEMTETRRGALWEVQGLVRGQATQLPFQVSEKAPAFSRLDPFETLAWDFRTTHSSPRGHPLEPLRDVLGQLGLPDARTVRGQPDGSWVRYAGIVICRQRPGTASGVVFMTLEDETGFVNVILWPKVFERFSLIARTVSFLGVSGRVQVADDVTHLIARKLWEPRIPDTPPATRSRDFH